MLKNALKTLLAILAIQCLCLAVSNPTAAQTPVSKATANKYYENCAALRDERMSEDTQNAFCACTSARVMDAMSMEELTTMYQDNQQGRNMLNKMLTDVYAPCMNFPVQDLVHDNCMHDENLISLNLKNPALYELCGCMSMLTGEWFTGEGRDFMADLLEKNPNITDPIGPVMESKAFKAKSYEFMTRCMAK